MSRRTLKFVVIAGLVVTASLSGLLRAAAAQAQAPTVTKLQLPVDQQVFNRLTGENVRLAGSVNLLGEVTSNPGSTQVKLTAEVNGTGTGQATGSKYVFAGREEMSYTLSGTLPSDIFFSRGRISPDRPRTSSCRLML